MLYVYIIYCQKSAGLKALHHQLHELPIRSNWACVKSFCKVQIRGSTWNLKFPSILTTLSHDVFQDTTRASNTRWQMKILWDIANATWHKMQTTICVSFFELHKTACLTSSFENILKPLLPASNSEDWHKVVTDSSSCGAFCPEHCLDWNILAKLWSECALNGKKKVKDVDSGGHDCVSCTPWFSFYRDFSRMSCGENMFSCLNPFNLHPSPIFIFLKKYMDIYIYTYVHTHTHIYIYK